MEYGDQNRDRANQRQYLPYLANDNDDLVPAVRTDNDRKVQYGGIYGLYTFDAEGECKKCHAADHKINKVGHCEPCQDQLDRKAGVIRK